MQTKLVADIETTTATHVTCMYNVIGIPKFSVF